MIKSAEYIRFEILKLCIRARRVRVRNPGPDGLYSILRIYKFEKMKFYQLLSFVLFSIRWQFNCNEISSFNVFCRSLMLIENLTLFPCNSALDFRPRFFFIGCWSSSFLSFWSDTDGWEDFSTVFISSGISEENEDDKEIRAWCLFDTVSSCFLSREAFLRLASIVFK